MGPPEYQSIGLLTGLLPSAKDVLNCNYSFVLQKIKSPECSSSNMQMSRKGHTRMPTPQLFNEWNNPAVTMRSLVASRGGHVPKVNVRFAVLCALLNILKIMRLIWLSV